MPFNEKTGCSMLQLLHRTRRFEIFALIPVIKQFLVPHLSFSVKVKFLELTQSFIDFQLSGS
jgi:hypothetical protein